MNLSLIPLRETPIAMQKPITPESEAYEMISSIGNARSTLKTHRSMQH
jgi:hypothetical protein